MTHHARITFQALIINYRLDIAEERERERKGRWISICKRKYEAFPKKIFLRATQAVATSMSLKTSFFFLLFLLFYFFLLFFAYIINAPPP